MLKITAMVILKTSCMEKILCVFLHLTVVLWLGVKGGTTPARFTAAQALLRVSRDNAHVSRSCNVINLGGFES